MEFLFALDFSLKVKFKILAPRLAEHFKLNSQRADFEAEAIERLLIRFHLAMNAITQPKGKNFRVQIPLFTVQ